MMTGDKVIGIDPGVNGIAYAIVDSESNILEAGFVQGDIANTELWAPRAISAFSSFQHVASNLPYAKHVFIEFTYARTGASIPAIATLGYVVGRLYSLYEILAYEEEIRLVSPSEWKHSKLTKKEFLEVFRKKLTDKQNEQLEPTLKKHKKLVQHNIIDAVGIALYGLSVI